MKYYDYKPGIPAKGSKILSEDIRNNFEALNQRTNQLLIKVTNPPSKKVIITGGFVYFNDNTSFLLNDMLLDLGSEVDGVDVFTQNEIGYFRDVFVYAQLDLETNNVVLKFIEGKSKIFNTPDFFSYVVPVGCIPIGHILVRNNGIIGRKGCIEPITINNIYDIRGFTTSSPIKYYTITVGDKKVSIKDFNNNEIISDGYTNGEINDIYDAINYVNSIGGGTVFLRKGVHIINKPLEIPSNIRIIGEGYHSILKIKDTFTQQSPSIIFNGSNIRLEHLTIIGDNNINNNLYGIINIFNCENCFITNTKIDVNNNSAYGIILNGSKNCTIRDNIITNAKVGIYLDQYSEYNIITHNHFNNITNTPAILIYGNNNIDSLNNNNIYGINEDKLGIEEIYIDGDFSLNNHRLTNTKAIKFNNYDGYHDTIIDKNILYLDNNNLYFKDNNNNVYKINNINIIDNTLTVSNVISNKFSFSNVDYITIVGGRVFNYINNQNVLNYNTLNLNYIGTINAPSANINSITSQTASINSLIVSKTYGTAIESKSNIVVDGYVVNNGVSLKNFNNSIITISSHDNNIGNLNLLLSKPSSTVGLSTLLYDGYNSLFFDDDNIVYEFTSLGLNTFTPNYDMNVEVIVVGGGGGGSNNTQGGHGGGGGGVYIARCRLFRGISYTVFVGKGGNVLQDGEDSYFIGGGYNFVAKGGKGATSTSPGQGGLGGGLGYNGGDGARGFTTPSEITLSICGTSSKSACGGVSILNITTDGRISSIHGGGGGSYGSGGTFNMSNIGYGGGGANTQSGGNGIVIIKKIKYL